jgi:hypothetical protein
MGESVAVTPPTIVVVLDVGRRQSFEGLFEILQCAGFELNGRDRRGGTRDANDQLTLGGLDLSQPPFDLLGQIQCVAMTFGLDFDLRGVYDHRSV